MLEVYLMLRNLVLALWHRNCKVRKKETPTYKVHLVRGEERSV